MIALEMAVRRRDVSLARRILAGFRVQEAVLVSQAQGRAVYWVLVEDRYGHDLIESLKSDVQSFALCAVFKDAGAWEAESARCGHERAFRALSESEAQDRMDMRRMFGFHTVF